MPRGKPLTLADIDMNYIRARAEIDPESGCWIWQRALSGPRWNQGKGYGFINFTRGEGKTYKAHRVAFYFAYGRWPQICRHTCDRSVCVNPDHLLDGTQADNMKDAVSRDTIRRVRGEAAPSVRLTEARVREIRTRYAGGGCSHRSLAAEYGVGPRTIGALLARRTWAHVA